MESFEILKRNLTLYFDFINDWRSEELAPAEGLNKERRCLDLVRLGTIFDDFQGNQLNSHDCELWRKSLHLSNDQGIIIRSWFEPIWTAWLALDHSKYNSAHRNIPRHLKDIPDNLWTVTYNHPHNKRITLWLWSQYQGSAWSRDIWQHPQTQIDYKSPTSWREECQGFKQRTDAST